MTTATEPQVERRDDGIVVLTRCPECQVEIVLPCGDVEPNSLALKMAKLIVCERCASVSELAAEAKAEERKREERLRRSRLPEELVGVRFSDADRDERAPAIIAAERWALDNGEDRRGLLLAGPVGVGKTWIAAAAANSRLNVGGLRWCSVAHLIARVQGSFDDPERKDAIDVLTGTGTLVLDDFDKVAPSEWAKGQLFTAIDRRITNGSKLLVTTNLKPSLLGERFGAPIVSRLAGYCRVFELSGRDRRLA